MFLGEGAISSYSRKLRLNTRSSTESELVSADMYLPEMLWSLYFLREQGYEVANVELFQDNISAQMLEVNGKFSSSKKTKHIRAKFFFIKDRIDSGDIRVIDCPTEDMWADGQSKPLQGKLFRRMRAKLMNCPEDYSEEGRDTISTAGGENKENAKQSLSTRVSKTVRRPQECVGSHRNKQNGTRTTRSVGQKDVPGGTVRSGPREGRSKKKQVTWAAVVAGK